MNPANDNGRVPPVVICAGPSAAVPLGTVEAEAEAVVGQARLCALAFRLRDELGLIDALRSVCEAVHRLELAEAAANDDPPGAPAAAAA